MADALDILLRAEIPQPQEKDFKHKRLSKLCGEEVIFTLKELGFSRVAEIKKMHEGEEMEVHIVLAGVKAPDFKDKALLSKYGAATPAELVKKLLLPGEITDMSREIEKLSGYRTSSIEEIKKK